MRKVIQWLLTVLTGTLIGATIGSIYIAEDGFYPYLLPPILILIGLKIAILESTKDKVKNITNTQQTMEQSQEEKLDDVIQGKICSVCGTQFKQPHGCPVACNACYFELDEWDREIFQKSNEEEL